MMRHFGPPECPHMIAGFEPEIRRIFTGLLDNLKGKTRIDLVDDFAFPGPVTVICKVLGVPLEAIPRFHGWIETAPGRGGLRPGGEQPGAAAPPSGGSRAVARWRSSWPTCSTSTASSPARACCRRMVNDDGPEGPLSQESLVSNAMLMLFAGHETTVNLIAHSVMSLLRHPDQLEKLRRRPELIVPGVEELLRFESSVQLWHTPLRPRGHRDRRHHHPGGRDDLPVLRLGEPRPGAVREPRQARPRAPEQRARRLQPGHPLLLRRPARAAGGPDRGQRVLPPRGEPAARRGPAAVPPQPDLPRPAPRPARHRRDQGLRRMTMQAFQIVESADGGAARGAGARARAGAGSDQGRRGGRLSLRPASHGSAGGPPPGAPVHASATRTRGGSRSSGRARTGSRPEIP